MSDKKEKKSKDTKKEKSEGKEKCKDKSQKRKYEEIEGKQLEKDRDEVKEAKDTKKKKSEEKEKCKDKSQKRKYEEIEEKHEKGCDEVKDKIQKKKQEEAKEKHVSHSANDWEHADLGDDNRRNKFLRLMGANKEHKGKEHMGGKNSHGRSKEDTEKVSEDLEEQYQQGLDMKLSGQARRHVGLGFSESEKGGKSYTAFVPAYKSSNDESDVPEDVDRSKAGEKKFGLFVKASK